MQTELENDTQRYFSEHCGVTFDALLAPINAERPGGESLRSNGVYRSIQEARRQDDPTLPMGPWEHELKRADWNKVRDVAIQALATKSKDLQLVAWLLEAEIHERGFQAISPCLTFIDALCRRYWEHLYPPIDEDIEYRTNVIHWINEKLLPVLRLVPLTHTSREQRELNWADWEQARRNEQLRSSKNGNVPEEVEGISTLEFTAAMAGTATEWHVSLYEQLEAALAAVGTLTSTLSERCGDSAPSLAGLSGLLEQTQMLIASALHKRGVQPKTTEIAPTSADDTRSAATTTPTVFGDGAIYDRASAYARLTEVAEYLMRTEPHSPTPYLLRRAIAWGNLNTAELYHELFVKFGGQLSIFELLGLVDTSAKGPD